MWASIVSIGIPILKFFMGLNAKKKLSDKEFVTYILAHQKQKSQAGRAAVDFETALREAQEELKAEKEVKSEEDNSHQSAQD